MDDLPEYPFVRLGSENEDSILIGVLGRMHGEADDFWDGNWLTCPVAIVAGSFNASITASLRAEEISAFHTGLQQISSSLSGRAQLVSMEDWLHLTVEVDRAGHFIVRGRAQDRLGDGNKLSFELLPTLELADIHQAVDQLTEIGVLYPVRGNQT